MNSSCDLKNHGISLNKNYRKRHHVTLFQKYKRMTISFVFLVMIALAWALAFSKTNALTLTRGFDNTAMKFSKTHDEDSHSSSFSLSRSFQRSLISTTKSVTSSKPFTFSLLSEPKSIVLDRARVPCAFNVSLIGVPKHVLAIMEVQMTIRMNDTKVVPDRLSLEATLYPSYRLEPLAFTESLDLSSSDLVMSSRPHYFALPSTVNDERNAGVETIPDAYRMDVAITLSVERLGLKNLNGTWVLERVAMTFYPETMVIQESDVNNGQQADGDLTDALNGLTISLTFPFNISLDLLPMLTGASLIEGTVINLPAQDLTLPVTIPMAPNLLKYVDFFNVTLRGSSIMRFATSENINQLGFLHARMVAWMTVNPPQSPLDGKSGSSETSSSSSSSLVTAGTSNLSLPFNAPTAFSVSFLVPKEVFQFMFLDQEVSKNSASSLGLSQSIGSSLGDSTPTLQLHVSLDQLALQLPTTSDANDRLTIDMITLELSQLSLSFTVSSTSLIGRFGDPDVLPYSLLFLVLFFSMTMTVSVNVITRHRRIIKLNQLKNTLAHHVDRLLP